MHRARDFILATDLQLNRHQSSKESYMVARGVMAYVLFVGLMVLNTGNVSGQSFPTKPIRVITTEAGGTPEVIARLVFPTVSNALGQPVVIENIGGELIPGDLVAKAPPDGATILVYGSPFWTGPLLHKAPYDPIIDFAPITLAGRSPSMLVAHPSLPVKTVKELIILAKSRPGELNYASGTAGAASHLSMELLKLMAGINITRIPYRGGASAVKDLIAGQVQLMFTAATSARPHVKSGQLRALGVSTAQPTGLAPGVPAIAMSGVPGFESLEFSGVFAPAKTPEAIIKRLNEEIVRVLKSKDVTERLMNAGCEVVGQSPEQLAATVKAETDKWRRVIKDAGIHGD